MNTPNLQTFQHDDYHTIRRKPMYETDPYLHFVHDGDGPCIGTLREDATEQEFHGLIRTYEKGIERGKALGMASLQRELQALLGIRDLLAHHLETEHADR